MSKSVTKKMLPPIENQHSASWHRRKFVEFVRFKEMAGEPSPHLRTVVHLSKELSWDEKVWRIGCYAVPYSVLSGEIIWSFWPYAKAKDTAGLTNWIAKHWQHFHIRTERRCVRTPEKFTKSLLGYHSWMQKDLLPALTTSLTPGSREYYDHLWEVMNRVPYFGRYIAIRALEGLRRLEIVNAELYDIRAIGGHSPVRCLTLFYPEVETQLLSGDEETVLACGEQLIKQVKPKVPWLTHYICAAMLCEYRKAYEDQHEYAARTQDQELGHKDKFSAYWKPLGYQSEIPNARREIFNPLCLGEIQGWVGLRPELGGVLRRYEYNWSDVVYDYKATTNRADFSDPVKR